MFCSRCGKTLDPSKDTCPHCGFAVGDSRMSGHTSVQPKFEPEGGEGKARENVARYTPYTKTSYTGEMAPGEDVYSRTAYRPVLVEAKSEAEEEKDEDEEAAAQAEEPREGTDARQSPEDEDEAQTPTFVVREGTPTKRQRESIQKLEEVPEDAPEPDQAKRILEKELDIKVSPIKPIKKTGISPEVESYMQRMEAMKSRARKKRGAQDETEDAPASSLEGESEPIEKAEDEEEAIRPAKAAKARPARKEGKSGKKWIVRVLIALLIVVLIAAGVVYLAFMTQPKSPVEGVSKDLFETGVQLIKSHATDSYRTDVVKIVRDDPTASKLVDKQTQDAAGIKALLPEKPLENDTKFIDTLLAIQKSIDAATLTDAMAVLGANDPSLSSLSDDSKNQWFIINNYITRLENATSLADLKAVITGVVDSMATPPPAPTPEPSKYATLKRGNKSIEVKELQLRLKELGWYTGVVDGKYGSITVTTVKQFQKRAGFAQDGIATPEVQEAIYAEDAVRTDAKATPAPGEMGTDAAA
ncbi:MAG: peptidoglycan-binding protein [Clostridia bacterium]